MSVKAGQLLHVGNTVLLDRAQTAGPGTLNIPTERIYELGNYKGVAIIRDIPDLSFSLESYDASAQLEALLTGADFSTASPGDAYDLTTILPLDVASQFKTGLNSAAPFDVNASACLPFLIADSVSYKFGLSADASQTVQLRGDSIYYGSGSAYVQKTAGTNAANQAIVLAHLAMPYKGDTINGTTYARGVTIAETGKRLLFGVDYTETPTGVGTAKSVTVTILAAVPTTQHIRILYASTVAATYPQVSHTVASATRPAAIRGRDIEIRVGGTTITDRWSAVQSFSCDWKVQLEKDLEFGNSNVISADFEVPDVSGTIEIKPRDVTELLTRIRQIAGVSDTAEVVGPLSSVLLPLEAILHSPDDGSVLKTLYVADARFTLPGYSAKVQSKLTVSFPFESDSGTLVAYNGAKP